MAPGARLAARLAGLDLAEESSLPEENSTAQTLFPPSGCDPPWTLLFNS